MYENETIVPGDVETPSAEPINEAEATEADKATPDDAEALESDDLDAEDADDEGQSDEDDGDSEDADDAGVDETKASDDGFVEVEDVNGKKHRVPKELEGQFMFHKGFTEKTQEVAELRKASDALKAATESVGKMTYEESAAFYDMRAADASLKQVNQELQKYANFNWQAAEQQDFDLYRQHENYFRQLTAQQQAGMTALQEAQSKVAELGQAKTEALREEQTKRIAAVEAFAKQNIDGWNQDLDAKIGEMAKEVAGVSDAWMAQNLTPELYHLGYFALIGKQTLDAAKAKPQTPPKAVQPTKKVKSRGGRGGQKSIEKMSMSEYEAARKSGALR